MRGVPEEALPTLAGRFQCCWCEAELYVFYGFLGQDPTKGFYTACPQAQALSPERGGDTDTTTLFMNYSMGRAANGRISTYFSNVVAQTRDWWGVRAFPP